jgi:hypothetical protein
MEHIRNETLSSGLKKGGRNVWRLELAAALALRLRRSPPNRRTLDNYNLARPRGGLFHAR